MGALSYLFVAYLVAFFLIGGFVLYLVGQVRSVRAELDELRRKRPR